MEADPLEPPLDLRCRPEKCPVPEKGPGGLYCDMEETRKHAAICFRRTRDGHVVAEILTPDGTIQATRDFGKFTEDEYRRLFEVIRQEYPDAALPVEVTEN